MERCFKEAARCVLFFRDLHQPLFVFTTATPPDPKPPPSSPLPALPLCLGREIKFRSKMEKKIYLHSAADGHLNLILQLSSKIFFPPPKSF